jgi:AraC-like DNA-binding protein
MRVRSVSHDSPIGRWRFTAAFPAPPLHDLVEMLWEVEGWTAYTRDKILPHGAVDVLFNLGDTCRVLDARDAARAADFRHAWVAGLQEEPLLVETPAEGARVGIRFRPGGAFAFFGFPLAELQGQVVDLDLVLGPEIHETRERLLAARGPEERLGILGALVAERVRRSAAPDRAIAHSLTLLERHDGRMPIGALAETLGISQEHLSRRFRREVGLAPKLYARIVKFRRVIERLKPQKSVDWPALALDCGYYDQAHFIRDFRVFAGATPTEFLKRRGPDGESVIVG